MDTHVNVHAQACLSNRRLRLKIQELGALNLNVVTLLIYLIGPIAQDRDELLHGRLDQARVGDPATIVAVGRITFLIINDALHGYGIFLWIIFNGN